MKRFLLTVVAVLLCVGLTGCSFGGGETLPTTLPAPTETTQAPTTVPETTVPITEPTTEPETEPTTEPETEPTTEPLPEHSAFYIPDVSVEDVILYFNEVCLDAEITHAGNPKVIQKWEEPIFYQLHGAATEEDLATLDWFTQWLNTLEGFPGIAQTQDAFQANLQIHFCTAPEMRSIMGDQFTNMDGAVTFWYMNNAIYDATICYRTEVDQFLRNSVILEEIYNGLGPIQDTDLRFDSIIYSGFSQPQTLTEMDELILKLLYHPEILPGMGPEACEEVIRRLYY